jgi:hypothetical protein
VESDATATPGSREDTLTAAVAGYRETLTAALAQIADAYEAGHLTEAERDEQAAAASARYERDYELATIAADTGWHCWQGTISLLYARRGNSTPPMVVRATTPGELREEIASAEAERRPS